MAVNPEMTNAGALPSQSSDESHIPPTFCRPWTRVKISAKLFGSSIFAACVSPVSALMNGDNFSNNILSGLAPILTLFGEQVAKQFMAGSTCWEDNIIFAMAPLGIITAVVGAIRIGGPLWLKAIIGRAREHRAAAEVELTTSTSQDVCELWNGSSIVRMMGSPRIIQLLYLQHLHNDQTYGLFTLQDAWDNEIVSSEPTSKTFNWFQNEKNKDEEEKEPASRPTTAAPNIYLNMRPQKSKSERRQLRLFALGGVVLQASVLVFSGFATYHPRMKYEKSKNHPVEVYAYPSMVIGTLTVVFGMWICSSVVERSTTEQNWSVDSKKYEKKHATGETQRETANVANVGTCADAQQLDIVLDTRKDIGETRCLGARILWLQQGGAVSDQQFDSYAILGRNIRHNILTSMLTTNSSGDFTNNGLSNGSSVTTATKHQVGCPSGGSTRSTIITPPSSKQKIVTLGTAISVIGFVAQFIGLRGMHWSATIAQLMATLVMILVRVWVRRDIALGPSAYKTTHDHELDWLATRIAKDRDTLWEHGSECNMNSNSNASNLSLDKGAGGVCMCEFLGENCWKWGIVTGEGTDNFILQRASPATKSKGTNSKTTTAHKVMKLRERISYLSQWAGKATQLAVLVANAIDIVMNTLFTDPKDQQMTWVMNGLPEDKNSNSRIFLSVKRDATGTWRSNAAEIEAVLSLWLYSIQADEKEASRSKDQLPGKKNATDSMDWLRQGNLALRKPSIRFLGYRDKNYLRDLRWYMGDGINVVKEVKEVNEVEYLPDSTGVDRGIVANAGNKNLQPNGETVVASIPIDSHRVLGFTQNKTEHNSNPRSGIRTFEISELRPDELETIDQSDELVISTPAVCTGTSSTRETEKIGRTTTMTASDDTTKTGLAIISESGLEVVLAQDMFSTFMWGVAKAMRDPLDGETTVHPIDSQSTEGPKKMQSFHLHNPVLSKLAKGVANQQLGSLEDIYLSIIPPLSQNSKLPVPFCIVEYAREVAKKHEAVGHWEEAKDVYLSLFRLCIEFGSTHPLGIQATVVLCEFYRNICNTANVWKYQHRGGEEIESIKRIEVLVIGELEKYADQSVFNSLLTLYDICLQNRPLPEFQGFRDATLLHLRVLKDAARRCPLKLENNSKVDLHSKDFIGLTPLHYAAIMGDKDIFNCLLKNGASPHCIDSVGWSPLHYAVAFAHEEIVKLLAKQVTQIGTQLKDISGRTPLHYAKTEGIAWLLLQEGAQPDIQARDGTTALHCAAAAGLHDVAKIFIEAGINVDILDNFRRSALHWAVYQGHTMTIQLLVKKGASTTARDDKGRTPIHLAAVAGTLTNDMLETIWKDEDDLMASDRSGLTAFHLAAIAGKTEQIGLIIDRATLLTNTKGKDGEAPVADNKQNTNAKGKDGKAPVAGNKQNTNAKGKDGEAPVAGNKQNILTRVVQALDRRRRSALHWAAVEGQEATARMILDKGKADIKAKDYDEQTALHLAAREGHEATARMLLVVGNADIKAISNYGETALHLAAEGGHEATAHMLLVDGKADVEAKDHVNFRTALHRAAIYGHEAMARMLLVDGKADIEAIDTSRQTALHFASKGGHVATARMLLLDGNADIKAKNKFTETALHLAAKNGHKETARMLLVDGKADIEAKDYNKQMPLHFAAEHGHEATARVLLVDGKADINAKDMYGETALHLAAKGGHETTARMLIDLGAIKHDASNIPPLS